MTIKLVRKPFKIGQTKALILPVSWRRYYGARLDTVTIYENGLLVIAPQGLKGQAEKLMQGLEMEMNNQKMSREV